MSEVMKPENECPFDPKQYECHSVIAPVGSFSWALIQLKLRKLVARSVWSDKKMYLAITPRVNDLTVEEGSAYAVDGVAVGTKYDYLTHIDLRNEHGNFVPWQPTQEDMMACDWELNVDISVPYEYMLVFDATPYETLKRESYKEWGDHSNSNLVTIENNISSVNETVSGFYWQESEDLIYGYTLNINLTQLSIHKDHLTSVTSKKLTITVDETKYYLGHYIKESSCYAPYYKSSEAEKVGNLLKQIGKTFRFYCNWHD
ncbi:DUF2829 domain-containing protein [Photorhabdus heterorhabditis]|uniref:DUF2829 domain-containing protein n=1 Tax=Photorhabdus heterorhabditis TaxID=880156 RepID=UPI001BD27EA9|nr:DUF2829 domain-containing protein [Photorhabdus heterorhabditis]MBS9443574.1 DUF2829 domain-containing protein [Photorhabdus heterorhabditis]